MVDLLEARRRILLNTPHLESLSGATASFETDMASKLKECRVHFTPVQEGSGDPSPDNVRAIHGWNGVTIYNNRKVPVEYQEVEYIESTGTQYIDLPFGFDPTDEIETNFSIDTSQVKDKYIVAPIVWNNDNNRFCLGVHNGKNLGYAIFTAGYGNTITRNTSLSPYTENDGIIHNWTYTNNVFAIPEYGLSINCSAIFFGSTTANLRLFYGNNSNTKGKIASYHHKKANGTEINLIPCYRKSDNEPGMYDTVSKQFYTNDGTGEFTVGHDVIGGEAYTIPFPQTIYGGYVDLVKGEVVEEYAGVVGWTQYKQNNGFIAYRANTSNYIANNWLCNMIGEYGSFNTSNMTKNIIQNAKVGTYNYLALDETANINDLVVVLPLATSNTYPLDPVTIRTLKGLNNIFSDANGNIEIKYWTH